MEYKALVKNENNNLEFLASFVSVWLTILLDLPEKYWYFLALGDNTLAVSWLHKASVDELENKPLHMATKKYAEILMKQNCCLYSQHIQRKGMESSLISLGLQFLFIRAKGGLSGRVDEGTCGISHILPELTGR
jgi:hypothetical protein